MVKVTDLKSKKSFQSRGYHRTLEKINYSFHKIHEEKAELNHYFQRIIGRSYSFQEALLIAQKAAKTPSTVLITGESGTGKELVAEAIHYTSTRRNEAFVKINCGAIPFNLLESELFGYEQGAFTGAIKRKIGKFEQAHRGTIFLDEIGDMPMEMQVKLLRVIQEKEFERVGGNETIKCDVRIISATHHNIYQLMKEGKFREDLYYRLNVIPIELPPLRERQEDISLLCEYFLDQLNKKIGKTVVGFSEEVMDCFFHYAWPGNIRELENLLERLIALTDGQIIEIHELPNQIINSYYKNQEYQCHSLINMKETGKMASLEEYEKEIIEQAIKKFGSFNAAGKALGITHKTVASKARKYNLVE